MKASCSVTGSFCREQRQHRLADAPALPEIAVQHVAEPVEVLDGQRPVEPELRADLRDDRGVVLLAGHDERRIARHQLLQQEDEDADEEQRRDDLRDPPPEIRSASAATYCAIDSPCSRIMPSGTARKPCSFAVMPTMFFGIQR